MQVEKFVERFLPELVDVELCADAGRVGGEGGGQGGRSCETAGLR